MTTVHIHQDCIQMDQHRREAEMIDKQLKHGADIKDKEHRHEAQN